MLQSEPSFELPERLQEYTGPPGDKKALVQWRQEQQVCTGWGLVCEVVRVGGLGRSGQVVRALGRLLAHCS